MPSLRCLLALALALVLLAPVSLKAEATATSIATDLHGLRDVPDLQRPAATTKIAIDIRTLPAGAPKVRFAYGLANLATEGDPGHEALQAVATTLAQALAETSLPDGADVPAPYLELARLIRYEGVSVAVDSPLLAKADQALARRDADVADTTKADFTLKDLHGKKVTLSELRGKIVLVNFWATWCPPCRKEMPDLDAIYMHFQSQGLVIISLSDENAFKVNEFIGKANYHPPVLLDAGGTVAKEFHVDGIPKSFVFDRNGKLVAQSIDMRTQHQFLMMLSKAGLHP